MTIHVLRLLNSKLSLFEHTLLLTNGRHKETPLNACLNVLQAGMQFERFPAYHFGFFNFLWQQQQQSAKHAEGAICKKNTKGANF